MPPLPKYSDAVQQKIKTEAFSSDDDDAVQDKKKEEVIVLSSGDEPSLAEEQGNEDVITID